MMHTLQKTERSGRVYTMADRPSDIDAKSWQMMINQGVVESSRGEAILDWDVDLFENDEEFEQFYEYIGSIRKDKAMPCRYAGRSSSLQQVRQ